MPLHPLKSIEGITKLKPQDTSYYWFLYIRILVLFQMPLF